MKNSKECQHSRLHDSPRSSYELFNMAFSRGLRFCKYLARAAVFIRKRPKGCKWPRNVAYVPYFVLQMDPQRLLSIIG